MKLTDPQIRMLVKAVESERGTAGAGLMDGPKRTARTLEDKGLGETFFYGCLMFKVNDAGREWVAQNREAVAKARLARARS